MSQISCVETRIRIVSQRSTRAVIDGHFAQQKYESFCRLDRKDRYARKMDDLRLNNV